MKMMMDLMMEVMINKFTIYKFKRTIQKSIKMMKDPMKMIMSFDYIVINVLKYYKLNIFQ
jgi:hypothetical protein